MQLEQESYTFRQLSARFFDSTRKVIVGFNYWFNQTFADIPALNISFADGIITRRQLETVEPAQTQGLSQATKSLSLWQTVSSFFGKLPSNQSTQSTDEHKCDQRSLAR